MGWKFIEFDSAHVKYGFWINRFKYERLGIRIP